jgi:hypothetical protein
MAPFFASACRCLPDAKVELKPKCAAFLGGLDEGQDLGLAWGQVVHGVVANFY